MLFVCLAANIVMAQNPNWVKPIASDFNFSANAICIFNLNGELSNNEDDEIAFFADGTLMGLSKAIEIAPNEYRHYTTIYSNDPTQSLDIMIYHAASDQVYEVAQPLTFVVSDIYGSVDDPVVYDIYDDNDAPIYIHPIPSQKTLEGYSFDDIRLEPYLVQVDDQAINWTYTFNNDLEVNISGDLLSVTPVDGFTGVTALTVRATEVIEVEENLILQKSNDVTPMFFEVDIVYEVVEEYLPPKFTFIPQQSIVKGSQFEDTPISEYEYQHPQETILYDYLPLIEESDRPDAEPSWIYDDQKPTSLTIVTRVDFTPNYQFSHPDDLLAAFIDGELRGTATKDASTGLYFLTIAGDADETSDVTIQFYSGEMKKILVQKDEFAYAPHKVIGTPDNPYLMEMSAIVPLTPTVPVNTETYSIPISIVDTSFFGEQYFYFIASDPTFPEYLSDTSKTLFCIAPDSSKLSLTLEQIDVINEFCPEGNDGILETFAHCDECDTELEYSLNGRDYQSSNFFYGMDEGSYIVHVRDVARMQCGRIFGVDVKNGFVTHPPLVDLDFGVEYWNEDQLLISEGVNEKDNFGEAVDLYDRYAVIGAQRNDFAAGNAGAAYVFVKQGTDMVQHQALIASDAQFNDNFGCAVAMNENYVVVGARLEDEKGGAAGAAYVYRREYEEWHEIKKLTASNGMINAYYGSSVDLNGKHIAVGAPETSTAGTSAGSVYIYEQLGIEWTETEVLLPTDVVAHDHFGTDVKLYEDWLIVGAPGRDGESFNEGMVFVFRKIDGAWVEFQRLAPSDIEGNDEFGHSLSIHDNTIVVGSPHEDDLGLSAGAAYVYTFDGSAWVEMTKLLPIDGIAGDQYAFDVDISAERIVIGSLYNDHIANATGATYIYSYDDSEVTLINKLVSNDPLAGDGIGTAVAINNDNILVGVPKDDDFGNNSGSAIFSTLGHELVDITSSCDVSLPSPTATGYCGSTYTATTDTDFPISENGEYIISWLFTNESGDEFLLTQNVFKNDTLEATYQCVDITLALSESSEAFITVDDVTSVTEDDCQALEFTIDVSEFNCNHLGLNTVTVTATDENETQSTCVSEVEIVSPVRLVINLNNEGDGSLRHMVDMSCSGDTIWHDVILDGSDISIAEEIIIDNDVVIIGLSDIGINANNQDRIFNVEEDIILNIHDFTLKNGENSINGGAVWNKGQLLLSNIILEGNKEDGQAKALTNNGEIKIMENTITEVRF